MAVPLLLFLILFIVLSLFFPESGHAQIHGDGHTEVDRPAVACEVHPYDDTKLLDHARDHWNIPPKNVFAVKVSHWWGR